MSEKLLTDDEALALSGTTDAATGLVHTTVGQFNHAADRKRVDDQVRRVALLANNLRVYEVEGNADAIGVRPGRCQLAGVAYSYAGLDPAVDSLANNDTTYIWAEDDGGGALQIDSAIDATGWPSNPHLKLAEVTLAAGVITSIVDRRADASMNQPAARWPMAAYGTWAIDGDGANTNGGGIVGGVTLTEAAAAFAVVDDNGSFALLSATSAEAGYTADYQLFPDTEAINDAAYFGHTVPFAELAVDVGTAAAYTGDALVWEYWDGSAWSALTLVQDRTDTVAGDGKRSFMQDGAVHFIPPADWASTTVNSQAAFWVRARVTAANISTIPTTDSKEHELVTPADGFACPAPGVITGVRLNDGAGTLHTTTDVKFLVVNFTSGKHSGELTFTQDKRTQRFTGLGLAVGGGDVLGVLVTQEDGTNEVTNALLELEVA